MAVTITEPTVEVASTTNAASYALGSFTPSANALLLAFAVVGAGTDAGTISSTGGLSWTRVGLKQTYNTTDRVHCFRAQASGTPAACVISYTQVGNATGCVLFVFQVTGHNQTSPIRQVAQNATTAANPTATFSIARLTGNGTVAGFGMPRNPPASTVPNVNWTETLDTGVGTPNLGASGGYRASGETATAVTFTSASAAYGIIAVEINDTANPVNGDATTIASAESIPTPTTAAASDATTIASAESVATPTTLHTGSVTTIASAESVGDPVFEEATGVIADVETIASEEAFGTPSGAHTGDVATIASAEALPTPTTLATADAGTVGSAEAFGAVTSAAAGTATAIASGEAVATPTTAHAGDAATIPSGEAVPTPGSSAAGDATTIPTAEAVGSPSGASAGDATSIASAEAFGAPSGAAAGTATTIPTAEAFGEPLGEEVGVSVAGTIPSAEAFGTPAGASESTATTIGSAETFGAPTTAAAGDAGTIPSAESVGTPSMEETVDTSFGVATTIPSGEAFGTPVGASATPSPPATTFRCVEERRRIVCVVLAVARTHRLRVAPEERRRLTISAERRTLRITED
jgi:hypothetical protein